MTGAAVPRVAVVVLNWNGLQLTRACVRSLRAQTAPAGAIVVVDNGSANGEAAALAREFGNAIEVLALPHNLGFAGGCNAAFERLLAGNGPDFVALLNNDAEAEPRWLEELLAADALLRNALGRAFPRLLQRGPHRRDAADRDATDRDATVGP